MSLRSILGTFSQVFSRDSDLVRELKLNER